MAIKFVEVGEDEFNKAVKPWVLKGYQREQEFTNKEAAFQHLHGLFAQGRNVIVFTQSKVTKYSVYVK